MRSAQTNFGRSATTAPVSTLSDTRQKPGVITFPAAGPHETSGKLRSEGRPRKTRRVKGDHVQHSSAAEDRQSYATREHNVESTWLTENVLLSPPVTYDGLNDPYSQRGRPQAATQYYNDGVGEPHPNPAHPSGLYEDDCISSNETVRA